MTTRQHVPLNLPPLPSFVRERAEAPLAVRPVRVRAAAAAGNRAPIPTRAHVGPATTSSPFHAAPDDRPATAPPVDRHAAPRPAARDHAADASQVAAASPAPAVRIQATPAPAPAPATSAAAAGHAATAGRSAADWFWDAMFLLPIGILIVIAFQGAGMVGGAVALVLTVATSGVCLKVFTSPTISSHERQHLFAAISLVLYLLIAFLHTPSPG